MKVAYGVQTLLVDRLSYLVYQHGNYLIYGNYSTIRRPRDMANCPIAIQLHEILNSSK